MLEKSLNGESRRITPSFNRDFKSNNAGCINVETCGFDHRPRTVSAISSKRIQLKKDDIDSDEINRQSYRAFSFQYA